MSKTVKLLLKYGGSALFVAVFGGSYLLSQDLENATMLDWYRLLCDAFSLPGMLMVFSGALIWLTDQGALDGIMYCGKMLVRLLIPGKRLEPAEKYGDYVERRHGKKSSGYGFLFLAGAVSIVISFIFLYLFHAHRGL